MPAGRDPAACGILAVMLPTQAPSADAPEQRYAAVVARLSATSPVTVLHLGEETSWLATGTQPHPDAIVRLDLGTRQTARAHFGSALPGPLGLEHAIAAIEDRLAQVREVSGARSTLATSDAAIVDIARRAAAGADPGTRLSIDAVERMFGRLVAVAEGRSAASQDVPDDAAWAAALVILRECMHHLRFAAIDVLPP